MNGKVVNAELVRAVCIHTPGIYTKRWRGARSQKYKMFALNITTSHPKWQNHNIHSAYNLSLLFYSVYISSNVCISVSLLFPTVRSVFLSVSLPLPPIFVSISILIPMPLPLTLPCAVATMFGCKQHLWWWWWCWASWWRYTFCNVIHICHTKRNKINKKLWIVYFPSDFPREI